MHLSLERAGDIIVVAFTDCAVAITGAAVNECTEEILRSTEAAVPRVLIDLGPVQFFSSSFIELLFRAWNRVKSKAGGQFALCNVQPYCQDVLEVTNLTTVWKIYPSRAEALAAMQADHAADPVGS